MSRLLGLVGLSWASDTKRALVERDEAVRARDLACARGAETGNALTHAHAARDIALSERDGTEAINRELTARINAAKACASPKMANIGRRMLRALEGS
jgi:hypothetical protein